MGYAYLKDGSRIDYNTYINTHPHWQRVREARLEFDGYQCVICHTPLRGREYHTHHLDYRHLGNEHLTDVVTLCPMHHTLFHRNWAKQTYWKGKEEGHWEVFDLEHTAKMCARYYTEDKFICKDADAPNLCNADTDRQYIDDYCRTEQFEVAPVMDPHDLELFVRNKRYEMLFEAEARGLNVEEFLDECYGPKVRGQNPIRREAGQYFNKHTLESFHKHYKENKNINILMQEVQKYAETQQF